MSASMRVARSAGVGVAVALAVAGCTRPAPGTTSAAPTGPPETTATAATTTTITAATTTHASLPPAARPDDCVRRLPLELRAGQVLMSAVDGDAIELAMPDVTGAGVGGLVLMSWPDGSDPAALDALTAASPIAVMLATDEEGGDVQRLRSLGRLPAAAVVASTMSPAAAEQLVAAHAEAVAGLGIDVVFAPVVDVAPADGEGPMGDRSFGSDPAVVTAYAQAYVDGWRSAGIVPVVKHFPGHGSATGDTHEVRSVTPPLAALGDRDLLPFDAFATQAGVGVMIGHLDVPGLTDADGVPASLSRAAITDLLRDGIGATDALVFTDALDMQAIASTWSLPDAAVLAIAAGADVALFTEEGAAVDVRAAVVAAVQTGRLSEDRLDEAVGRVLAVKRIDPCGLDASGSSSR